MMRVVDHWASRISWRWGVTAIVALVTMLVVVLVLVLMPRGGPAATASATTGTSAVPRLPPSSAPDAPITSSPSTPSTPSTPSSPSALPTTGDPPAPTPPPVSGPGVSEPGITVSATPQPDGSLEVLETAIYRAPVEAVMLLPVDVRDGGPPFAALVPTVSRLRVTADGRPVGVLLSVTEPTTVPLPTGARRVVLRYHLDGVTVRSTPSTTGRASILIAPLSAPTDVALPSQIRVGGRAVLNLTCPRRSGDARECAPATGDLGVAPILAAGGDVVVAQVDLPTPS